jgi:diguanylate cyclase (GGDEF)-like protein
MLIDQVEPRMVGQRPAKSRSAWLLMQLDAILFTTDYKQRLTLHVLALTALVYATCIGLLYFGAASGVFIRSEVIVLAAGCILHTALFYAAVRSGWNQRFSDPTLAFPQTVVSQTLIAFAYAITGPAHPATLLLLALVMVFGMFTMRIRAMRLVALYTIVLIGLVMAWKWHTDPLVYPFHLEIICFALTAAVLPAIAQLTTQLMSMRGRIKQQKAELQRAQAHITDMATRDDLTKLPNRRRMMELLEEHAMRLLRGAPDFYVAMVDLDHFRNVNDSYGHAVGDEVLRAFAMHARAVLRNTDWVGRWGGEEFLLLLPETPPGEPTIGVARLRGHLHTQVVHTQAPALRIEFSAGFARYEKGEGIDQVIERADRALQMAKAGGRNQTVVL